MKLRNKKTGEIVTLKDEGDLALLKLLNNSLPNGLRLWEEVKEPLIKDEKIRKAVRTWAEANAVKKAEFEYVEGRGSYLKDYFCEVQIEFYDDLELTNRKTYTIAELCGEEEE